LTVRTVVRPAWPVLVALLAGSVGRVEGQSPGVRSSLTVFAGHTFGGPEPGGLLVGLELRSPELGRLSAATAASTWQFVEVACDVIPGGTCPDERVKAFDIGPVVRLTPCGRSWRLEATARIGGHWDRWGDRVWNPSAGVGFGFGQSRRLGGLLGLRYHALTSSRPSTLPNRPDTRDYFAASAGLQLRF
jgi:hypothetical protein